MNSSRLWVACKAVAGIVIVGLGSGCGGQGKNSAPQTDPAPPPSVTQPDTQITSAPETVSSSRSATFNASSSIDGSVFEISFDNGSFNSVVMPYTLNDLPDGEHSIAIRARTSAGTPDPSPAVFSWTVDATAPEAAVVFPPRMSYTDATSITVRGTAIDPTTIASLKVNGIAAISTDDYKTWTAEVPLVEGVNTIAIAAADALGNSDDNGTSITVMRRGPAFASFGGMDYDPTSQLVIVADSAAGQIYSVDPDGVVSILVPRTSDIPVKFRGLAVDSANNRALVLADVTLDAIDLGSRARSTISHCSNAMIGMSASEDLALDAVNNRAYLVTSEGLVAKVELGDGLCTVISSGTVGTGPFFVKASAIAYDDVTTPASPRILIGSPESGNIIGLDPATGQRSFLSYSGLQSVASMRVDAQDHRLVVLDTLQKAVVSFDLQTATPTILGNATVGSGPDIAPSRGLAIRSSDTIFSAQQGGEIIGIDTGTLAREVLTQSDVGDGPRLISPSDLLIEQASGSPSSLLVTDNNGLVRVDLANGERNVISSAAVGTGPFPGPITSIARDTRPDHVGHIFGVMRGTSYSLVSIDLANGDRELIVDSGLPSATRSMTDVQFNAAVNRLVFSDVKWSGSGTPDDGIYAVDLTTTQQIPVSNSAVGDGPSFNYASNLILDPAAGPTRALVSNSNAHNILAVDLETGNRSLFGAGASQWSLPGALAADEKRIIGFDIYGYSLFSVPSEGGAFQALSGLDTSSSTVFNADTSTFLGRGPMMLQGNGLEVDTAANVAYLTQIYAGSIMAIDLVSGDRVLISH